MPYVDIKPESSPVTIAAEEISQYSGEVFVSLEPGSPTEPDYELPTAESLVSDEEKKQEYWPFLNEPTTRKL